MDFASLLENLAKKGEQAKHSVPSSSRRPRSDSQQRDHRHTSKRPRNDQEHNDLRELLRCGFNLPRKKEDAATSTSLADTRQKSPRHLALLMICIDDLPYEDIWKAWINDHRPNKSDAKVEEHEAKDAEESSQEQAYHVSVLVHAKHPDRLQSPWLRQRHLRKPPRVGRGNQFDTAEFHTHAPEWGSVQITRAMIDLLREAERLYTKNDPHVARANGEPMGDEDVNHHPDLSPYRYYASCTDSSNSDSNDHNDILKVDRNIPPIDAFVFVSETCLPVATLQETMDTLLPFHQLPFSCVNARNFKTPGTPHNKYEKDQFLRIDRMIPKSMRWKADQWLCLVRPHARLILQLDEHLPQRNVQLWQLFANINASDEMYFPTSLALAGVLSDEDDSAQLVRRAMTYTDWSQGMRNPASFHLGTTDFERVSRLARAQGSLFARKFVPMDPQGIQRTGDIRVEDWKDALHRVCEEVPLSPLRVNATVDAMESKEIVDTRVSSTDA